MPKGHSKSVTQRSTDTTMAKRKRTNNDLQNTTQKTKDLAKRTPQKTGSVLRCSGMVSSSTSTCGTRRVTLVTNPVISHEKERTGKRLRQVEHIRSHL